MPNYNAENALFAIFVKHLEFHFVPTCDTLYNANDMKPEQINLVLLDCDGVVLESVGGKSKLVLDLFSDDEEKRRRIKGFHRNHPGMHREELFAHILKNIYDRSPDPSLITHLCWSFGRRCVKHMSDVDLVKGTWSFLKTHHEQVPIHVVSGTPQQELRQILKNHGIAKYFRSISGSPPEKTPRARHILADQNVPPEKTLFVGDAQEDMRAADDIGTWFAFRESTGEVQPDADRFLATISDLEELSTILKTYL